MFATIRYGIHFEWSFIRLTFDKGMDVEGNVVEVDDLDNLRTGGVLRRASETDVPALVDLRAHMLTAMGEDVGLEDAQWRVQASDWFQVKFSDSGTFAAYVVDLPGVGVVSSAAGLCDSRAPSQVNLSGVTGHVFNVSTLVPHQRHGYAHACLVALLEWFDTETEAAWIGLNATDAGERDYRKVGFADPAHRGLRRWRPR